MKTIQISGVTVYDVECKRYRFIDYLTHSDFKNGRHTSPLSSFVFVSDEPITRIVPERFDATGAQLADIERQRRDATDEYEKQMLRLRVEREAILAVEKI